MNDKMFPKAILPGYETWKMAFKLNETQLFSYVFNFEGK